MKPAVRIATALLALGAVAAVAVTLSQPTTAAPVRPERHPAPLPAADQAANSLTAIGIVASANQATLAFQLGGKVEQIDVKEGDRVTAGTTLASIDSTALEIQVAQAQAALDAVTASFVKIKAGPTIDDVAQAKSNLDRAKEALDQAQAAFDRIGGDSNPFAAALPQTLALQQAYSAYQGAVASFNLTVNHPTASELAFTQAQVTEAQAALDLAKQTLANAKIVAPFDGTAAWIGPHVGEYVSPGAPAITLVDLSHLQVSVGVDENALPLLKVGQSAAIKLDALPGATLTGRVGKIGDLATTTGGIVSVPVTIDVDSTQAPVFAGLSATVDIDTGR